MSGFLGAKDFGFLPTSSGGGGCCPISSVTTCDTNTFAFYGVGTSASPLCGCPQLSPAANQGILVLSDGLWSPNPIRSGLVYGGIVTWLQNYDYSVSAAGYYINGVFYTSPQTTVTLPPSDPTLDRIDLFVVTTSGIATSVTGTPATPPQAPTINPDTELAVSFAFIAAASTQPVVTSEYIYLNNAEWTAVAGLGSGINVASTNNPFSPPFDVEFTNSPATAGNVTFTRASPIAILNNYNTLVLYILSKGSWAQNRRLFLAFRNGTTIIGTGVSLTRTSTAYGFDYTNTTTYQRISIPLTDFGLSASSVINNFYVQVSGTGISGSIGLYMDNIELVTSNNLPNNFENIYIPSLGLCSTIRCNVGNTATAANSASLSGSCNAASGACSVVLGGSFNSVSAQHSVVSGGFGNTNSGCYSFVGGGFCNTGSGTYSFIGSGFCNLTSGTLNSIVNGTANTIPSGSRSSILSGQFNTVCSNNSAIVTGACNRIFAGGQNHGILSGCCNFICSPSACSNVIINGNTNNICTTTGTTGNNAILGGCGNCITGTNTRNSLVSGRLNCIMPSLDGLFMSQQQTVVFGQQNHACGTFGINFIHGVSSCVTSSGYQTGLFGGFIYGCFNRIHNPHFSAILGGAGNDICTTAGCVCDEGRNFIGAGCRNLICNGGNSFIGAGLCNTVTGFISNVVTSRFTTVSGDYSGNLSGCLNIISSSASSISGGFSNTVSGNCSFIAGGACNVTSGQYSFVGTGFCNIVNGTSSFVGSGCCNSSSGNNAFVGGGFGNVTCCDYSVTVGGYLNTTSGGFGIFGSSFTGAGCSNNTSGFISFTGAGGANVTSGCSSFTGAGQSNSTTGVFAFTGAGNFNTTSGCNAFTGSGNSNITGGCCSFTGAGSFNTTSGAFSFTGSGCCNTTSGGFSAIIGGGFNQAQAVHGIIGGGVYNNVCNSTSGCLAFGAVVVGGVGNNTTGGTWNLCSCCFIVVPTICNAGQYSFVGGGFQNIASGDRSSVLGGQLNNTCGFADAHIIGSCLCASQVCTTFVNCLSAANLTSGCLVCVTTNNVLTNYTELGATFARSFLLMGG